MMEMNKQILENIMTDYNKKRLKAAHNADIKKENLYERIPELKKVDDEIKLLSIKLSKLFLSKPDNINELVLKLREEIDSLKKHKAFIYEKNNIPENYLEIEYECKKCNDTGYLIDGKKCSCLNKQIISNLYTMSNME